MQLFSVRLIHRQWLTPQTLEARFDRPADFAFQPGQKITFATPSIQRDYTLIGAQGDSHLAICVRHVPGGRFSPLLAAATPGDRFEITPAFGFFTFKPSPRRSVFVATGTGIAPFVAFVRSGVRDFDLLHGVRSVQDLYYRPELSAAARRYRPCLSAAVGSDPIPQTFSGHVDACLAAELAPAAYDFYLCGRNEMIRDVVRLIDERFPDSHVFTEPFF